jgi:hypothetical protein
MLLYYYPAGWILRQRFFMLCLRGMIAIACFSVTASAIAKNFFAQGAWQREPVCRFRWLP